MMHPACHDSEWKRLFAAAEPHLSDQPQTSTQLAKLAGVKANRLARAMTLAANCKLVTLCGYLQKTRLVALYVQRRDQ